MIHLRKDFWMSCRNCKTPLTHPKDSSMISWRGEIVYEDTIENIKEVAKDVGWDDEKILCGECK